MIPMVIQDKKNLSVVSWIWNSKVWSILRLIGKSNIGSWQDTVNPIKAQSSTSTIAQQGSFKPSPLPTQGAALR